MNLRAFAVLLPIVSASCGSGQAPVLVPEQSRRAVFNCRVADVNVRRVAQYGLTAIGGDASWIPLVIEALKQSRLPREDPNPEPDTLPYCVEALQIITNQEAGRYAADWQAWYDANKARPQRQWLLDGFRQRQFPVADPIDHTFAAALIRASVPEYRPAFIRTNALRLLQGMPFDALRPDLETLLASTSSRDRRGVVAALEEQHGPGAVALLRRASADADLDVAENALRALNEKLRRDPRRAPLKGWDVGLAEDGVHILARLGDRSVMVGIGYGVVEDTRVVGFDVVTREILWTYKTASAVRSLAVRLADRFYFLDDEGTLCCLSGQGQAFWTRRRAVDWLDLAVRLRS